MWEQTKHIINNIIKKTCLNIIIIIKYYKKIINLLKYYNAINIYILFIMLLYEPLVGTQIHHGVAS